MEKISRFRRDICCQALLAGTLIWSRNAAGADAPFTVTEIKLPPGTAGGLAGRPIEPSTMITVGKGAKQRQMNAQTYVDSANKLREAANARGLSLRNDPNGVLKVFLGEVRDQVQGKSQGAVKAVPGIPGTLIDKTFGPPFLQLRVMAGAEAIQDLETFGFRNLTVLRLKLFGIDRELFSGVVNTGVGYRENDKPFLGASVQYGGVEQLSDAEAFPSNLTISKTIGGRNVTLASYTMVIPVFTVLSVNLTAGVFFESSFLLNAAASASTAGMDMSPTIQLGLNGAAKVSVQVADAGITLRGNLASVTPQFKTSVTRSIVADRVSGAFTHGANITVASGGGKVMFEGCFYLLPLLGLDPCGDVELFHWDDLTRQTFPVAPTGTDTVTLCVPTCSAKRCGKPDTTPCGFTCPACGSPPVTCNGQVCQNGDTCCVLSSEFLCTSHATCERKKKAKSGGVGGHVAIQKALRSRIAAGRATAKDPVP